MSTPAILLHGPHPTEPFGPRTAYLHNDGNPTSVVPRLVAAVALHGTDILEQAVSTHWSSLFDDPAGGSDFEGISVHWDRLALRDAHEETGAAFAYVLLHEGVWVYVYGADARPYQAFYVPWLREDPWASNKPSCDPVNSDLSAPCTHPATWLLTFTTDEDHRAFDEKVCALHLATELAALAEADPRSPDVTAIAASRLP